MNAEMLAAVLATGAAMALPVKAGVDAVKRALPDLPPWALLGLALLIGQALAWLVALYSGAVLDPRGMAGIGLAGLGATGAAIASTELHKAARPASPSNATAPLYVVAHGAAGHVAFLTDEAPAPGARIEASEARHVDGSPIDPVAPIRCDGCGAHLAQVSALDGVWVAGGDVPRGTSIGPGGGPE